MKKLFICETPFQIIVSLFIKQQFTEKNDEIDIVISDTFANYDKVAAKLNDKRIYSNVYTIKIKDIIFCKGIYQKLKKIFLILFPKLMIKKKWTKNIKNYDEIYCSNYDIFTSTIRSYYGFRNIYPKIFFCEEAYISYFPFNDMYSIYGTMKFIESRNKLFIKQDITRNNIDGLFLFEPKNLIYKPNCKVYKIESALSNKENFKDLVDYIFNASKVIKNYDKKYIIFEEAMYANDPDIDDEKIFDEIINIVGKDNVIIKLHPRTSEDRFTKKGIKTLGNDGTPWEALACVGDFSDKVLITISSGSIPTYKNLFGNKINAYMLFKFIKSKIKAFDSKYYEFWDKFSSITEDGGIHLPKSKKEFYQELKKEVKKSENM